MLEETHPRNFDCQLHLLKPLNFHFSSFLFDGKVWMLLCDLPFGDDLSHNPSCTNSLVCQTCMLTATLSGESLKLSSCLILKFMSSWATIMISLGKAKCTNVTVSYLYLWLVNISHTAEASTRWSYHLIEQIHIFYVSRTGFVKFILICIQPPGTSWQHKMSKQTC